MIPTRLFHLHFNTPDVSGAEQRLAERGLPLYLRFGRVDGEYRALDPNDPVLDDFRLRLQNAQRGYANVTLAPGQESRFDHLGLCTIEFDALCDRTTERGWLVRDRDGRRTFVTTPWRFRVELHPDGSDVESELGSWDVAHFERIEITVPDSDADDEFRAVFGDVPGFRIRRGDAVCISQFRLAGSAFPDETRVETDVVL